MPYLAIHNIPYDGASVYEFDCLLNFVKWYSEYEYSEELDIYEIVCSISNAEMDIHAAYYLHKAEKLREAALSKLTDDERIILGV